MTARLRQLGLAFVLILLAAPGVHAQQPTVIDTVNINGRTSWEDGYLSGFAVDRAILGGRARGMGGTGLALLGGPEQGTLNPTAILGMQSAEIEAEFQLATGGAGVDFFPALLVTGPSVLQTSNYRVSPKTNSDYNNLSFGLPLTLLGRRGALSLTYRRVAQTGPQDETRVELRGPVTNQADATFGIGDLPDQGMDAFTATVAREITDWWDLGASLNWYNGNLVRDVNIGVAIFGFNIFDSVTFYNQDVKAFNVDLGTRFHFGKLKLAGAAYLGYDMKYEEGRALISPIPVDPNQPNRRLFINNTVPSHQQTVPTIFALGGAYEFNDRFTVALDYWIRPWSESEITRVQTDAVVGFLDPFRIAGTDTIEGTPGSFAFDLVRPDPEAKETFNAKLENTNSLRVGLEYAAIDNGSLRLPLRLGFRTEKLVRNNITVDPTTQYPLLVLAYFEALKAEVLQGMDPGTSEAAQVLEQQLQEITEFNNHAYRGSALKSNTFALGVGFEIQNWAADITIEKTGYNVDRFFLQDFDPLLNPIPAVTEETRSLTTFSFTMRMNF